MADERKARSSRAQTVIDRDIVAHTTALRPRAKRLPTVTRRIARSNRKRVSRNLTARGIGVRRTVGRLALSWWSEWFAPWSVAAAPSGPEFNFITIQSGWLRVDSSPAAEVGSSVRPPQWASLTTRRLETHSRAHAERRPGPMAAQHVNCPSSECIVLVRERRSGACMVLLLTRHEATAADAPVSSHRLDLINDSCSWLIAESAFGAVRFAADPTGLVWIYQWQTLLIRTHQWKHQRARCGRGDGTATVAAWTTSPRNSRILWKLLAFIANCDNRFRHWTVSWPYACYNYFRRNILKFTLSGQSLVYRFINMLFIQLHFCSPGYNNLVITIWMRH